MMVGQDLRPSPAAWCHQFKPPDDAISNEQVLTPFYAALRIQPRRGWELHEVRFKYLDKGGERLDSLQLTWAPIDDIAGLQYFITYNPADGVGFTRDERPYIVDAVKTCQYLQRLRIQVGGGSGVSFVTELLSGSFPLRVLRLYQLEKSFKPYGVSDISIEFKDWLAMLEALKGNKHLKMLDLSGIVFSLKNVQRILGGILDLLQVNSNLEDIDLSDTLLSRDGSDVKVKVQLQKNAAMREPSYALKGLPMLPPSAARVFLCGFPFAGKTQLRKTMAADSGFRARSKEYLKSIVPHFNLLRTTGIEVEVLQRADVKISLWDLGGQDEYHAFHDLLIPNVNGYKSACSFVVVCSSITREDVRRIKHPKFKDKKAIESEVDYWMRFIASNSTISEAFKPRVTLVLTHGDYVPKDSHMMDSLNCILSDLKLNFEDSLEIVLEPFIVNARFQQSVQPLVAFLDENVREILKKSSLIFMCVRKHN